MRAKIEKACLGLLALVFCAVALIGLLAPRILFDPTGIELDTRAGLAEIRAAYGGLFGALAYLFARGVREVALRGPALTLAVLVLGGFVGGRLLGWALDGTPDAPVAVINLVAEGVGFALALWLRWGHRAE